MATRNDSPLTFRVSEDGGRLLARREPGADCSSIDLAAVRALVAAQGFGHLHLEEDAVARLLEACTVAEDAVEQEIGGPRDGVCRVTVTHDKMAARLTLVRACGGVPVTDEQIRASLQHAGVSAGIQEEAITSALSAGEVTEVVVACGRPAQHGAASVFVSLISQVQDRHPKVDEHGFTDYRDLGRIAGVSPGDPVMRRTPATSGCDGYDVTGRVLQAKAGRSVAYGTRLKGVVVDAEDPELLRAAISGRPLLVANGMTVESTIELPRVDMSTGNIDFDGSVTVLGDVLSRMKIRATGDVLVRGRVSAADIEAGGQVVLQGGFMGALNADDDEDHVSPQDSGVRCAGLFHARFVEYARVESGEDILIDEHAMFSTLLAARHVVVGAGGGKGQILGGTVTAIGQVTAQKYGGPSGAKTLVSVGLGLDHRLRLEHLEAEIEMLAVDSDNVARVDRLRADAARLKAQLELAELACVSVGRTVYPGTRFQIGGKGWSAVDEHPSGVFRVVEGNVLRCPK